MPTPDELKAAEEAAAKAEAEAKDKEAEELAASGITTDAGKDALRKEREAKRAAEKLAKERADELAALKAEKAAADEAKRKADEEAQAEQGKFRELAENRKTQLDALTGERDALKAKVDAYEARDRKQIDDGIAAIKADWPDVIADFAPLDPGPDAPIDARMAWFEAVRVAASRKQKDAKDRVRVPSNPQPNGRERGGVDKELQALRTSGRYGI